MNWFERYSIPGIYFVSFASWIFWGPNVGAYEKDFSARVAFLLTSALPIGYVLTIISQIFYYKCLSWSKFFQIHRRISPADAQKKNELDAEVAVTALGRWEICEVGSGEEKFDPGDLERRKWISEWITKRVDVIAIDKTMMLSTAILAGLLIFSNLKTGWPYMKTSWLFFENFFILLFVWLFCWCNSRILTEQIIKLYDKTFKTLKPKEKVGKTKSEKQTS